MFIDLGNVSVRIEEIDYVSRMYGSGSQVQMKNGRTHSSDLDYEVLLKKLAEATSNG